MAGDETLKKRREYQEKRGEMLRSQCDTTDYLQSGNCCGCPCVHTSGSFSI